MNTVAIVGPGSSDLTERLVGHLSVEGSVATVSHLPCAPAPGFEDAIGHTAEGAGVALGLSADGWSTYSDHERSLDEVLCDLAPEYDYCLLDGFEDTSLPTISTRNTDTGPDEAEPIATVVAPDTAALADLQQTIDATEPFETLGSLVAQVKRSPDADRAGAIATFTGRVREKDSPTDAPTERLEFEKYEGVADERMAAISADLEDRDGVFSVTMHHRTGVIENGEDIVFVVVLAGHREEAFRAVENGINRLKDEVPLFKKEITATQEFWIHEQP